MYLAKWLLLDSHFLPRFLFPFLFLFHSVSCWNLETSSTFSKFKEANSKMSFCSLLSDSYET